MTWIIIEKHNTTNIMGEYKREDVATMVCNSLNKEAGYDKYYIEERYNFNLE